MDIAAAMYNQAWSGNPPDGLLDFPSACCYSCTQQDNSDFAMHPINSDITSEEWAVVSDFPEYCPMMNRPLAEPGTTDQPWKESILQGLTTGYFLLSVDAC